MNLTLTEQAANWYEKELDLPKDASLRFYVRYGGSGGLQPGFSLAIKRQTPENPIAEENINEVTYFVEEEDSWYFDDQSIIVELNEAWEEPEFKYEENKDTR
ncbi:HesB/YadR/YfhF family protein [Halobacillus salinarum]|uniref:HesB/YadR/YfhF family protein n=1 Tax=Halobacillus salinarum TaxID=2932257 RepID=A0ABY4EG32_9BACI|nr:HesB/YadR/YfhF family protein [Halobacillus salinarum]UOQ42950.1 HesB/YadR/YfhF family protein [Halobacillus salinarum]